MLRDKYKETSSTVLWETFGCSACGSASPLMLRTRFRNRQTELYTRRILILHQLSGKARTDLLQQMMDLQIPVIDTFTLAVTTNQSVPGMPITNSGREEQSVPGRRTGRASSPAAPSPLWPSCPGTSRCHQSGKRSGPGYPGWPLGT